MFAPALQDPAAALQRLPGLCDRFEAAARSLREVALACAHVLADLHDLDAWAYRGCASAGEFGERFGLSADETRSLRDLGLAIRRTPLLEQQVREGLVTVPAACCVARVLAEPNLECEDDDWIGWAQTESTRQLQRRARQRLEEARAGGEPVVPVSVFVRQGAREEFDRARGIASQKARRALTPGETFEVVVEHYLDTFDADRVGPGKRRVPDTAMVDGRYVPMAVRREIYERQGRQCAVPFCEHFFFLEKAHLVAHARGGSREADNLLLLCSQHHLLLDTGLLRFEGSAALPTFRGPAGEDLTHRFAPAWAQHLRQELAAREGSRAADPRPAQVRDGVPDRAPPGAERPRRAQRPPGTDPPRAASP